MLTPNIAHHAMLRLRETVLRNCIVHIADGVSCPACGRAIRTTDPEDTDNGNWRIVCGGCHRDLFIVEESRP
jgi:hypothetical protein